ncbi:sugar diacid recognition domain-containing protein [Shewanella aquimarina]
MAIIGHNINVMNSQGVILGSGEPHRIGSTHEGALLAISQNRTVALNSASAASLQGVKPGINLPLHYQGEIIGVIGITGEPEQLMAFGELLKMTAEMIVEQANSLDVAQWRARQQEEFILQLIKPEGRDLNHLKIWAKRLDIDLELPRVAAVLRINDDGGDELANSQLKTVLHLLETPSRGNLIAMTSMTQLVILKPAFLDGKAWSAEAESLRIDRLLKRLPSELSARLKIALGHYFPNTMDINRSYQTALETLNFGQQLQPERSKYLYEDHALLVMLSGLKHDWRGEQLLRPFQRLIDKDKNALLRRTLASYLGHFGDQQACAKALFIHRNTLRYRLDKIAQITQVDIHKLDGLLQLYLGQVLLSRGHDQG